MDNQTIAFDLNSYESHVHPQIPAFDGGVYQSFPRPYLIGKSLD
jgi:hypothetical protein